MRAAKTGLALALAGIKASVPYDSVRRVLRVLDARTVEVAGEPIANVSKLVIVGTGKASCEMAAAVVDAFSGLEDSVSMSGHVVTKHGHGSGVKLPRWLGVTEAAHPVPDESSVRGAQCIIEQVCGADSDTDLVVALISGGGSSLCTLPQPGLALSDLQATTEALLACGAPINEINEVRRALDSFKAGGLAAASRPARLVTLVLSDVVGDPLHIIASGPTIAPSRPSRCKGALLPLVHDEDGCVVDLSERARRVLSSYPTVTVPAVVTEYLLGHREDSRDSIPTTYGVVTVVGSNATALEAVSLKAERLGFRPVVLSSRLEGDAAHLAANVVRMARECRSFGPAPFVLVGGGETVVRLPTDHGAGGRNQHFALRGALELERWGEEDPASAARVSVVAVGTDGTDGPTDGAGGIVTSASAGVMRARGFDPEEAERRCDSYHALESVGRVVEGGDSFHGLVVTGATGTNVMDLYMVVVDKEEDG
jgi:glycerate 2-kinase